ncbi:MAG TPA: permease, partial [Acidimicrobiales bacterium]|nr:permease [Acidimicrobiales bacterium]
FVQSAITRDSLRRGLGDDNASSLARASLLGALSSSCSYAASAMARALFARGASWTNSVAFMVASTNLVIELGVVLYLILGWRFLIAQLVGGVIMIGLLGLFTRVLFRSTRVAQLRERVLAEEPRTNGDDVGSWQTRLRRREALVAAARYTTGDLTMIRTELVAGFLVAGFLSVHVPASWWNHLFISGHGGWTVVENVLLAPLVAVLSCVCSVGNIPLAATLWGHGVAFGGVIAFIFADLITLPLLAIYRRFYGAGATGRILVLLWGTVSLAGLAVEGLFRLTNAEPRTHHVAVLSGDFPLGATLVLNIIAAVVLLVIWRLSRSQASERLATDPVCGMSVEKSSAAATVERGSSTYYFCSPRCREHFLAELPAASTPPFIDPVCGMSVEPSDYDTPVEREGVAYYFCSAGCRKIFVDAASPSQPIE